MRAASVLLLALLLAGCAAPAATPGAPAASLIVSPAVEALRACGGLREPDCFEPGIAVDAQGRLFVGAEGGAFARSVDGGATFEPLAAPPRPPTVPAEWRHGDVTLEVDASGRLFWVSLLVSPPTFPQGFATSALHGVQLARSDDGGASWSVSRFLSLASSPPAVLTHADRPWLAFGEGDEVFVVVWSAQPRQALVARSPDGGASFSPFLPIPGAGIPGRPAAHEGRLLVPSVDATGTLRVAASDDGGRSFQLRDVGRATHPLSALAVRADGTVGLAWLGEGTAVLLSTSGDGGASWEEPARVDEGSALRVAPALLARADGFDVAYFAEEEGGSALLLARDGTRATLARLSASEATTDLAWLAPAGAGVAFAWTDEDGVVRAARAGPSA